MMTASEPGSWEKHNKHFLAAFHPDPALREPVSTPEEGKLLDEAIQRYLGVIFKAARQFDLGRLGLDHNDLWQDLHGRLARALALGRLHDPEATGGWLYKVTFRHLIDLTRRRNPLGEADSLVHEPCGPPGSPTTLVEIAQAIALLPPDQAEAYLRIHLFGYTQQEHADSVGVSKTAIQKRLVRVERTFGRALRSWDRLPKRDGTSS